MRNYFEIHENGIDWLIQVHVIIEVDQLDRATLIALSQYLIDHINLIPDNIKTFPKDAMWPLQIRIKDQFIISEYILWQMICDTLPNGKDLVLKYVNSWCDIAPKLSFGELPFSDGQHPQGGYALIAFLDRYLKLKESATAAAIPVFECFMRFFKCSCLLFESFQDEYLEHIFDRMVLIDSDKTVEYLCYRLCNGKYNEKEFAYLHKYLKPKDQPANLKKVIDCLIDHHYKDHQLFLRISGIFHRLCASVYGCHLKPTQEVIDYVSKRINFKLFKPSGNSLNVVKRIRSHCDTVVCLAEMEQGYYDTSFHIYDAAAKRWLPMGAELPKK